MVDQIAGYIIHVNGVQKMVTVLSSREDLQELARRTRNPASLSDDMIAAMKDAKIEPFCFDVEALR